jgi:L-ribulokinase
MGSCTRGVYTPDPASADIYDQLYAEYVTLHDYFGRGANEVLHRLRALRDRVLASRAAAGETAKAPASQSQGPQAIGGSGGALPRARGARP